MDNEMRMTRKTVAIIAGQLSVGGAERQLYLWLAHLDRKRFRPVVVTLHPDCGDYWEKPIESLGIPLVRVPRRSNRMARLINLTKALRPYQPHLVHAWHLFASPYGGASALLLGVRSSLGSLRGSFEAFRTQRIESRLTMLLTRGIVVNSRSAGTQIASTYERFAKRVYIIPNAVESQVRTRREARAHLNKTWNVPEAAIWIGSMGRLQPGKRFDLLLTAFQQAYRKNPNVHLILFGNGPELTPLKNLANQLQISAAVTFTGAVPEARSWLSALDIFCFPSLDEGLPNVVMEAAAASVPIVAWKAPFIEELLQDGWSAILAPPPDVSALETALLALIENEALRAQIGGNGYSHILHEYGLEQFVERMSAAYQAVLRMRH